MRILIIEDNEAMSRMIRSVIAPITDDIHVSDDGANALVEYERLRPDWVLMDICLKTVDGLTATRRICRRHPDARVMIVTNFDDASYRESARAAGAVRYLVKDDLYLLRRELAQ